MTLKQEWQSLLPLDLEAAIVGPVILCLAMALAWRLNEAQVFVFGVMPAFTLIHGAQELGVAPRRTPRLFALTLLGALGLVTASALWLLPFAA